MNVLILGAGKRCQLTRYFQDRAGARGFVAAGDYSKLAPARYTADKQFSLPAVKDPSYVDHLLGICREEEITLCIPTLDIDLDRLADHHGRFAEAGTTLLMSGPEAIRVTGDKWAMYEFCVENGIATPRSWVDPALLAKALGDGEVDFPLFAKPISSAGSTDIAKLDNHNDLSEYLRLHTASIVQEYVPGAQIDVDVYIDLISHELVSAYSKHRLKATDGNTSASVSFKDPALFDFIGDICSKIEFCGPINIELFAHGDGSYSLLEINPRFSWAYPHAHEAGVDFIELIATNLAGSANERNVGNYEEGQLCLAYDEVVLTRIDEPL